MTKRDLLEARQRACRDRGLSHGAARLFCVLVDTHYLGLIYPDEDEWDASGPTIEQWLNCGERQAFAYRAELLKAGYIRYRRLRGCPPAHVFSFVQSVLKGGNEASEKDGSKHPKGTDQSVRKGRPLTKSTPSGFRVAMRGGEKSAPPKAAPAAKKAKGHWWDTPPQFEELDPKCFARERKALGASMVEWLTAERDRLKVEWTKAFGDKPWSDAAKATWEALGERRQDVKKWVNGVRR